MMVQQREILERAERNAIRERGYGLTYEDRQRLIQAHEDQFEHQLSTQVTGIPVGGAMVELLDDDLVAAGGVTGRSRPRYVNRGGGPGAFGGQQRESPMGARPRAMSIPQPPQGLGGTVIGQPVARGSDPSIIRRGSDSQQQQQQQQAQNQNQDQGSEPGNIPGISPSLRAEDSLTRASLSNASSIMSAQQSIPESEVSQGLPLVDDLKSRARSLMMIQQEEAKDSPKGSTKGGGGRNNKKKQHPRRENTTSRTGSLDVINDLDYYNNDNDVIDENSEIFMRIRPSNSQMNRILNENRNGNNVNDLSNLNVDRGSGFIGNSFPEEPFIGEEHLGNLVTDNIKNDSDDDDLINMKSGGGGGNKGGGSEGGGGSGGNTSNTVVIGSSSTKGRRMERQDTISSEKGKGSPPTFNGLKGSPAIGNKNNSLLENGTSFRSSINTNSNLLDDINNYELNNNNTTSLNNNNNTTSLNNDPNHQGGSVGRTYPLDLEGEEEDIIFKTRREEPGGGSLSSRNEKNKKETKKSKKELSMTKGGGGGGGGQFTSLVGKTSAVDSNNEGLEDISPPSVISPDDDAVNNNSVNGISNNIPLPGGVFEMDQNLPPPTTEETVRKRPKKKKESKK